MTAVATPDAARLVFAAVAGLILLLILIIKFKVHAMISILIGAVGIGLMAGMPLSDIIGSVNEGIGNTLKGIALLVGLGSMFGAILEESGGAQTLAVTMVRKFGDEKAAWALGITGLVVAMPVFFDAGLIILIPLAFSLAKRTKRSVLYYVIPLLAGLAVGHAFIPPTPGPVLVATMLGVDLGWVILVGIFCGIFAMIAAGPIWGSICGKKYMVEVPEHVAQQADIDESKLPKFGTIVGIIMIPLLLIIANSVAKVVPVLAGIQPVLAFLGEPFMALLPLYHSVSAVRCQLRKNRKRTPVRALQHGAHTGAFPGSAMRQQRIQLRRIPGLRQRCVQLCQPLLSRAFQRINALGLTRLLLRECKVGPGGGKAQHRERCQTQDDHRQQQRQPSQTHRPAFHLVSPLPAALPADVFLRIQLIQNRIAVRRSYNKMRRAHLTRLPRRFVQHCFQDVSPLCFILCPTALDVVCGAQCAARRFLSTQQGCEIFL